jgi:hypothetical protein
MSTFLLDVIATGNLTCYLAGGIAPLARRPVLVHAIGHHTGKGEQPSARSLTWLVARPPARHSARMLAKKRAACANRPADLAALLDASGGGDEEAVLVFAAQANSVATVRMLLGRSPDVDRTRAVEAAAHAGHLPVLRVLMRRGFLAGVPDAPRRRRLETAALSAALQERHSRVAHALLRETLAVLTAENGAAILQAAATNPDPDLLRALLQHPAVDVGACGRVLLERSALHVSNLEVVLADPRVDVARDGANAVARAPSGWGCIPSLLRLLDDDRVDSLAYVTNDLTGCVMSADAAFHIVAHPRRPHAMLCAPVMQALVRRELVATVRLGLSRMPPDADLAPVLEAAVSAGAVKVVALLLSDPRVDPRASPVMQLAVRAGPSMMRVVIADDRVDPSQHENAALREAVRWCNVSLLRTLLQDTRVAAVGLSAAIHAATQRVCHGCNMEPLRTLLAAERWWRRAPWVACALPRRPA